MANCSICGYKMGFLNSSGSMELEDGYYFEMCQGCIDSLRDFRHYVQLDDADMIKSKEDELMSKAQAEDIKKTLSQYLLRQKNIKQEEIREKSLKNEIDMRIKSHKLTTGYNFEGYNIKEYLGVISGSTVVGTGLFSEFFASGSDLLGTESNAFSDKMEQVKDSAMKKLLLKSTKIGGNALIGIDYDFINFSSNMIGVSANGTAVVIEKEGE